MSMKGNLYLLTSLLTLSISYLSNAQELELNTVLKSTKSFFPEIISSIERIKESEASLQESEGAFDLSLRSEVDRRFGGYYDGNYFDVILEKPLPYLNSKFYVGHRKSENNFPLYEGKKNTLDSGESRIGFQISLWRDRDIDSKRQKLRNNQLKLKLSEQGFALKENEVLKNATKAYWNWVTKGFTYRVNQELLTVMQKQLKVVKSKIAQGAMAKIYETENLQYIQKRKTKLAKSLQEFKEAAIILSLFLRDSKGLPLNPDIEFLPNKIVISDDVRLGAFTKKLEEIIELNPKLNQIKLKDLQFKNELLAAENILAPKVDVKFEVSKDHGEGSKTLEEEERRVMLQIEIPIERNRGNGKIKQVEAKREILLRKKQFEVETLTAKLEKTYLRISTYKEIIKNSLKEVELTKTLQKAERRKFQRGTSDLFVINLRDQDVANAQIRLLEYQYLFEKTIAEYKSMTMSF